MSFKPLTYFAILVASLAFTQCATIISGSKQSIIILSDPRSAHIEIDGISAGRTPLVTKLKRQSKHFVKLELDGFKPYEMTLTKKVNGWVFANILLGGIIGIGVDAATGAMFTLSPKEVFGEFTSTVKASDKKSDGLYVTVVLKPDAGWKKIGQLEKVDLARAN